MEITLACTLNCRHCGSSAGNPRKNELTTEEAHNIYDQLPQLLVQYVDFTGGESLLRQDLTDILHHLSKLGINVNILTNGLGLDYENILQIKKEAGVSCLGISLDGLEKSQGYLRNCAGAFKRVINSIKMVLQENVPLHIITTVTSLNVNELPDILHLLQSLGAQFWRVQPSMFDWQSKKLQRIVDPKTDHPQARVFCQAMETYRR
jgi:MoaA/NifB/PqqE/SkfB family radical SAM enzyme